MTDAHSELVFSLELEPDASGPDVHALGMELQRLDERDAVIGDAPILARMAAGHVPRRRVDLLVRLDDRTVEEVEADIATLDEVLRTHERAVRRARRYVTGRAATPLRDVPVSSESVETVNWRIMRSDLRRWAARAVSREGPHVNPDEVARALQDQANAVRRLRNADGQ